jgi:GntR family transcriptional regulator
VETRRGRGVFVTSALPTRGSPRLREEFLKDTMIRAAALGMTPDDVAVGALSGTSAGLAPPRGVAEILLIECSPAELDFFARELGVQLPVRVDKVLLGELAGAVRRRKRGDPWRAAVTSFGHLPDVERLLDGRGVPVLALLAEAHLETLHRLAQLPSGTRIGVISAEPETAHNLENSIANAALPNIVRVEAGSPDEPALSRLVRRVDAIVCSSSAVTRVKAILNPTVPLIVDDRALNQRAVQMLGAILVRQDGERLTAPPPAARGRRGSQTVRALSARPRPRGDGDRVVGRRTDP